MRIVILFVNVGTYHAARLRAADAAFAKEDWELIPMQLTDNTFEHPWGDLSQVLNFPLQTIYSGSMRSSGPTAYDWTIINKRLQESLARLNPDVVFIPGWGTPAMRKAIAWCNKNNRTSILMSETKKDDSKRNFLKEYFKKKYFLKKFDSAIVGGKPHLDYLVELGFDEDHIFTGYDVVDNDYFLTNVSRAAETTNDNPTLLTITRMMPRKNIMKLVSSYAKYREICGAKSYDLTICGEGEQRQQILEQIDRLGLSDHINLPGFVSYSELPVYLANASALVHPALSEQWGLVINEACASGLPILCSSTVGACSDLVKNDVNGYMFNPHSEESITTAIVKFHNMSAAKKETMGQKSIELVGKLSPERFGKSAVAAVRCTLKEWHNP